MKKVALLAAVALAAPLPAAAYIRTKIPGYDTCLYWRERTLGWSPSSPLGGNVPEAELLEALRRSFAVWEAEACSDLAFTEGAPVDRTVGFAPRGPNVNTIVFRDRDCSDPEVVPDDDPCRFEHGACDNLYDCWGSDDRLIAVTTSTFSQCSGRMVDSDIEFNGPSFKFTILDEPPCQVASQDGCVATDVMNTAVHEIGHVIGLDHTLEPDATMEATAGLGETKKRDLSPDDQAAICDVYPSGEGPSTCEPARPLEECGEAEGGDDHGNGGCGCGGAGGGAGVAGLLAASALFLGRRRRA